MAILKVRNTANDAWIEVAGAFDEGSGATGHSISDDDGDTGFQTQKFADEDILRMDAGGLEVMTLKPSGIHEIKNSSHLHVTQAVAQGIAAGWETVQFANVLNDLQNEYDEVTNYRFTADEDGVYSVYSLLSYQAISWPTSNYSYNSVRLNGTVKKYGLKYSDYTNTKIMQAPVSLTLWLDAGDWIDIQAYNTRGETLINNQTYYTYLCITKVH